MFSWSTSTRKGSTGRYPGQVAGLPVAQTVQGSIRPPSSLFSRQQHIDSFRNDAVLRHSTRQVSRDDTTFDTVFQTTSGVTLILRIVMPLSLESQSIRAPQFTLVGVKGMHPWLNDRLRVVGYPAIESDVSWQQSRLLLGQVVNEVVQHLQLNPPVIYEITDPALLKLQPDQGGTSSTAMHSQQQRQQHSRHNHDAHQPPEYDSLLNSATPSNPVDMPSIPGQYPELLDSLTREELQHLLADESVFSAAVRTLPVYQEIELLQSSLIEENTKKAMSILEREEEYKMLHGEVKDMQESFILKMVEFETLEKIQAEVCQPPDEKQLKLELNLARKVAMDESENYAMEWVEDGRNVAEFCKKFVEQRNLMHMRAAKVEMMEHTRHNL